MLINDVAAALDRLQLNYDNTVTDERNIFALSYEVPAEQSSEINIVPIFVYAWTAEDDEEYIRLAIPYYLLIDEHVSDRVYLEMARINDQLPQAKLFVDNEGDVGLATDLPALEINDQSIKQGLARLACWAVHVLPRLTDFVPD